MATIPLGDIPRFHAARKPAGALAVSYPDGQLTWSELESRANRRARFYASLGVVRDDLVAVAMANGTGFHEALFAIWKLGATPAMLSPRSSEREFRDLIALMKPRLVLTSHARADDLIAPCIPGDADTLAFADSPLDSVVSVSWKAVCSGGSTGRPKVIVDHQPGEVDPLTSMVAADLKLRPDGVLLNPGPLYHNSPVLFTSWGLFTGSTVIGMDRFDAEEALRLIERHRVNWVCLVPTMMHRIWSLPREVRERYDLSSLEAVWHMAAPCPPWLKQAWIEWLGPERIWELYGGTERFGRCMIRGDEWLAHRGSVGRVSGGAEVRARRDDGQDCAVGEVGELYFRLPGDAAPSHYIGAVPKRDDAGWLSIGDLGYLDAEGYVYLADRRTDLILRGGANIYPAEIEGALDEHPAVASSIVVGLPSDDLGATVHALLELKPGARDGVAEIHQFLADRLTTYKLPQSYELVEAPLRDDAGKARRSALREERVRWLEEGRAFQIPARDLVRAGATAPAGGRGGEG